MKQRGLYTLFRQINRPSNKQGSVLMLVLGLFAMFIILFLALSSLALRTSNETVRDMERQQAFLNAKSVLQALVEKVNENPDILNNLRNLPLSTEASITQGTNEQIVQITINTIDNNPNKLSITATGKVNEQTGTINAVFERASSGGNGSGWISQNKDLFKYAIASRNNTNYGTKTLQHIKINGDIYSNDEQFGIGINTYIKGNVTTRVFKANSNANGKRVTIDGNVFVKERMNSSNSFNNVYINGSVRFLDAVASGPSIFISNSVITNDLILNKHNWHSGLTNSVIGGDVISLSGEGNFPINGSVVYGDVWFRTLADSKIDATTSSYIRGRSNMGVSSFIKKPVSLKATTDYSAVTSYGNITALCGSICTAQTITKENFPVRTDLPVIPPNIKSQNRLPATTVSNAISCENSGSDHAICYLNRTIQSGSMPVYVKADINYSSLGNPWNIHFDIDSNKILGNGEVYFIFDTHKHYVFDNHVGDFASRPGNKPTLFFLMGSNVTYPIDIENNFNGYIYTVNGVVRLKGDIFNGAVNSEVIQICGKGSECADVPASEPRVINYKDPLEARNFTFKGYN